MKNIEQLLAEVTVNVGEDEEAARMVHYFSQAATDPNYAKVYRTLVGVVGLIYQVGHEDGMQAIRVHARVLYDAMIGARDALVAAGVKAEIVEVINDIERQAQESQDGDQKQAAAH